MATKKQEEQWLRADEELREKLLPGVKLLRTLEGHTGAIDGVVFSVDRRFLASKSRDGTVRVWSCET